MIHLRLNEYLQGHSVFRVMSLRAGIYAIEAVIKIGNARAEWITLHAMRYGRELPAKPKYAVLSRSSDEVWTLYDPATRETYLLTNCPETLFDAP